MKPLRLVYCLVICLLMLLVSGCTLTISLNDSPIGDNKTSVLPDPQQPNGNGDPPVPLDDAQQARQAEVDRYILDIIYHGATITQAIQLPSGDIIDGLDRNTLPAISDVLPLLPWAPADLPLPPGVEVGLADFEQYPELLDLVTTSAPMTRPDFSEYVMGQTDATSIEDYLERYTVGGAPSDSEHLYAGLISHEWSSGVFGYMNQFRPEVDPGSFSLVEFAVGCDAGGDLKEQIGVVISVDKANGWDAQPRLHVEYARQNPYTGKLQYVWDARDGQFVLTPFRRHRPGEVVPVSVLAGTQVEHLVGILHEPVMDNWWIWFRDEFIGYYPGTLFTMFGVGACRSGWYGEVARRTPDSPTPETWPNTRWAAGRTAVRGLCSRPTCETPCIRTPLLGSGWSRTMTT